MMKEVALYLQCFEERVRTEGKIGLADCKEYIQKLPVFYKTDLEFRLLFDWHFSPRGKKLVQSEIHPLFKFQSHIIGSLSSRYDLSYHFFILLSSTQCAICRGSEFLS